MTEKLILVTGGAGYIGSHTVRALQKSNYDAIVLDNLVYGHRSIVEKVLKVPLVVGQVGDSNLLMQLLTGSHPACAGKRVTAVLHFAAYAYVGESVDEPAKYYRNNLGDSLLLLEALKAESKKRNGESIPLVFSSTCATYGLPSKEKIPISESTPQSPINPYGSSKFMVEKIITDFGKAYNQASVIFRYFNAAGADPQGDLGELHIPETHLIPLIFDALTGEKSHINIFGNDYPTHDGTCIRDYIHVSDLADAHVLGLKKLLDQGGQHIYNLGNENGYSVQEVIKAAEKITSRTVPIKIAPRRAGDPPVLIACAQKAQNELNWNPNYKHLDDILKHAWQWYRNKRLELFSEDTFEC